MSKTSVNMSGFLALKKQLQATKIEVGYVDAKNHWWAAKSGHFWPVSALAADLHFYSPWADSFMLSETKYAEINATMQWVLKTSFGKAPFSVVVKKLGEELKDDIVSNIQSVNSPSNNPMWASYKGFNNPLVFGSEMGYEPNLVSEVSYKIKGVVF
jgi:hypothetical protein